MSNYRPFHLETLGHKAILLGAGPVRLRCVRQWRGRVSWLRRPLHPGVGFPGWPRLGLRKGDNIIATMYWVNG